MNKKYFKRYSRHFLLDEVGFEGQRKLSSAKVLIVGVGGLGSPVALYLAAAGIGTLGIVEFDTVDDSNLQRQILYDTNTLEESKVRIASQKLQSLNPLIKVVSFETPLTKDNAKDIFRDFDYIVDATDNFATRYLINDICCHLNKIYVYGSVYEFEGQVSVFCSPGGPTYRDLYPFEISQENLPTNLEKGILGSIPGVVGSIQATEILKLILNVGEPLIGYLLMYDALDMSFTKVKIKNKSDKVSQSIDSKCYSDLKQKDVEVTKIKWESIEKNKDDYLIINIDDLNQEYVGDVRSLDIPINKFHEKIRELQDYANKCLVIDSKIEYLSTLVAKGLLEKGLLAKVLDKGGDLWEDLKK